MTRIVDPHYFLHICLVLTYLFYLISCSNGKQEETRYIDIRNATPVNASDVLHIDKAIPLKNGEAPFIAGLDDVFTIGDRFIAHDRNRIIYIFDLEGNLLSSSESVIGHGHGEYDNMLTCNFNQYNKTVEVITPLKIKIYDSEFNFIEERSLPSQMPHTGNDECMFSEIYDLGENVHALLPSSTSHNKNSIIIFDSLNDKVLQTIDYGSDLAGLINMQKHSFTDLGDSIVFYPPGIGQYVYSFDKEKFYLTKGIKIDGLEAPDDMNNETRYMGYALNSNDLMPLRFLCIGDKACFLIKEGNDLDSMSYMISGDNGKMNILKIRKDGLMTLPILTWSDGKSMYGLCDSVDLHDYYASMGLQCPDSLNNYDSVILRYVLN